MEPVLRVHNITKRFGSNVANDHISFDLYPGEIHALLGENGAGKSTLMNVIYGVYGADEGEVYLRGQQVEISSPKHAIELGIGMVHQHFMLIPAFTVAENIVLGMQRELRLDIKDAEAKIAAASEKYDLRVEPHALVSTLSVGEQQRVEILKVLFREQNVILDEPTAVLTPQEITELFATLERLKKDGVSIVFISHKLNELMSISDRISILRRGKITGCIEDLANCNPEALASAMVGRQVTLGVEKPEQEAGEVVLELDHLSVCNEAKKEIVKGFSLQIRAGENRRPCRRRRKWAVGAGQGDHGGASRGGGRHSPPGGGYDRENAQRVHRRGRGPYPGGPAQAGAGALHVSEGEPLPGDHSGSAVYQAPSAPKESGPGESEKPSGVL